ncbi:D-alanyl-D-alanine endopeptidase (penicillin-binding protein 7) [Actimicrobium sp. GrIS 1.19]|uniref:D-alanyl-D-alanine endopeptidase n=1 Tax=Actimicrobium sp. GrIS 1.19 TaxID=3071708 RepID=UPI002DFDFC95|nr:D-alanyl-D-alanine endopeptidase (penicillin-binding protein 7) [Actimicrobium sp. GrIS 1.19]
MSKPALALLLFLSLTVSSAMSASDTGDASAAAKKHHTKKSTVRHRMHRVVQANPSLAANEKLVRHVSVVHGKRRVSYQRVAAMPSIPAVPPVISAGDLAGLNLTRDPLDLKSSVALVMDQSNSKVLFEKNANVALPIASITKLMTSMVVVESHQNMDEVIEVTNDDIDKEKFSSSRLRVGAQLSRANMLHIALMSSENRAASALGRNYPGGLPAFVAAMNAKAKSLGMNDTHYVDSTGLSSHNVASAQDLAKLVIAARQHPIICQYSTDTKYVVEPGGRPLQYANSNHLVANPSWEINLQKTGYISEAGRCLVMMTNIEGRPIVMVFLDSKGKQSRLADAGRIRKWIEAAKPENLTNPLAVQASAARS